jgi:hypothetical protein
MLDPKHPSRSGADEAVKMAVQRDFAECIQQLSLFPPGCAALKANPDVVAALDALVERARSDQAKDCARGALMQLTDRQPPSPDPVDSAALHVMMSYQW